MKSRSARPVLILTLFGAGFGGLALEVVWIRELALVFGANTHAMSTVLASYMAGLALGSIVLGRWAGSEERTRAELVRRYALLLAGMGVVGMLVALAVPSFGAIAAPLLRFLGWNPPLAVVVRGVFGFLVLLVPTFLIGGLFPIASQLAVADSRTVGRELGVLYSVNTLGSVAGALLTGFLLLEKLGLIGTALLAAAISLAMAGASLLLPSGAGVAERTAPEQGRDEARVSYPPASRVVLVLGFALSGFAALGYEVVWTRALVTVMGQPVYGYTVVLASFLFGLALGGIAAGRLSDRWHDPVFGFGVLEWLIGTGAILALVFLSRAPVLLGWVAQHWSSSWGWYIFGHAAFAFGVMFVPAFWMGMTFPVANRAYVPELKRLGARVGALYAANTVGALAGSLAAGFVLLPLLGTSGTNLLLAGVGVAAGIAALLASRSKPVFRFGTAGLLLATFIVVALFLSPRDVRILPPAVLAGEGTEWTVSFHRESVDGVVTTARDRTGTIQTWVNSSVVCGSGLPALKPVRQMGFVPFAVIPEPQDILVIGYGLGVAASMFVDLSGVRVDCVEIAPAVVAASREFTRWNNWVYANPRLNVMAGDGRNYLLCTDRMYDIISCDPTHPALGSGALYTTEFYQLCLRRLRPGGVMTQYLPLHRIEPEDFRALVATFRTAFPNCALWRGISHGVLVGRKGQALSIDYGRLAALFDKLPPRMRAALAEVYIDTPGDLLGGLVLNRSGIEKLTRGAGIVNDNQPRIEFTGARASDAGTWRENAQLVFDNFTGPNEVLYNFGPDSARVQLALRMFAGAEMAKFKATLATMHGRTDEQVAEFRKALAWNPNDREARILLRMSGAE